MELKEFEDKVSKLLFSEPFYAEVSAQCKKYPSDKIKTMCVSFDKSRLSFVLLYNKNFVDELDDSKIKGCLKHEFMHIIFGHLLAKRFSGGTETWRDWNIATDYAINSFLYYYELPKDALCASSDGFYSEMSAEYYMKNLKKRREEFEAGKRIDSPSCLVNPVPPENHEGWAKDFREFVDSTELPEDDVAPENSDMEQFDSLVESIAKDITKNAAEKAESQGWGSIMQACQKKIKQSIVPPSVSWKRVLRYFVVGVVKAEKYSSYGRINKRFPYIQPGKRYRKTANIAVSIDQSGSVSTEMLKLFLSELTNLSKLVSFTIIPFDTTISEEGICKWKKGQQPPEKVKQRYRSGGTNFDIPTIYVNERKEFDGHIVFTDMYADPKIKSRCKRIWVTNKNGKQYADYNWRGLFAEKEQKIVINVRR